MYISHDLCYRELILVLVLSRAVLLYCYARLVMMDDDIVMETLTREDFPSLDIAMLATLPWHGQ